MILIISLQLRFPVNISLVYSFEYILKSEAIELFNQAEPACLEFLLRCPPAEAG
jgi:hypothetical protein